MNEEEEEFYYTEAHVSSLVASHNLDTWKEFVKFVLKGVAPIDTSISLVEFALKQLRVESNSHLTFVIDAGKFLLAAGAQRSAVWSAALFNVREALANWCVQAGDEIQAQEIWRAMLPSDNDMITLQILTNLLNSAIRTRSYLAAETECLRGLSPYKALSMQPEANDIVNEFLYSFATLLAARHRFIESAQRFYELYTRTGSLSHLRGAIVCAIQADASTTRSRMLGIFHKEENSILLGELYTILTRASHSHILRPSDIQRFLPYVEPTLEVITSVESAFIQHNLQAISRFYYNIGFKELGDLLGISAFKAERLVAQMVSERRLEASLDQITETVIFSKSDNTCVLEAWDARISSICEELAQAADLIVSDHAEFNEYLLLK